MNETIQYIGNGLKDGILTVWRLFVYIVVAYSILVGMFAIAALGFLTLIGIDTGIPQEIAPYFVIFGYVVALGLLPAELVRQWISDRYYEYLHVLDPANGDAGFRKLSPSRWGDLTVKTVYRDDGELVELERDRDFLHRITVDTDDGEKTGWECEYYDDGANTAYCSYYGGVSGTEIRREMTDGMEYLKHEASAEREWYETLRRNFTDIVEDSVGKRVNYLIHVLEDERVPGQSSLRDDIREATGEAEIDDIVEGRRDHADDIDRDNPFEQERLSVTINQGGENE